MANPSDVHHVGRESSGNRRAGGTIPRQHTEAYDPILVEQWKNLRQRRAQRHTRVLTTFLIFLGVTGGAAYGHTANWWSIPFLDREIQGLGDKCDEVGDVVETSKVKVIVLNATDRSGIATNVAAQLRDRGFDIQSIGDGENGGPIRDGITIQFRPSSKSSAETLKTQFESVMMREDPDHGPAVTVTVQGPLPTLVTPDVASQRFDALVQNGKSLKKLCRQGR